MILGSQKDIRTRVQEALLKHNIKQIDVARETGIHHSTLSLWLQGKNKSHYVKNEQVLEEWLKNLSGKPNGAKSKFGPQSVVEEDLIPITLKLDSEGKKEEIFCWNYYENRMTPEVFARLIVQENSLPVQQEHEIAQIIKRKIENHRPSKPAGVYEQCIRTIELDIRVDKVNLRDKFEWDIGNPNNSPQLFAISLCKEMGLNSEFCVKIAHQIREKIILLQKTSKVQSEPPREWLRIDDEGWQPKLEVLDAEDLKKIEKLKKRQHRYINRLSNN